MNQGHFLYPVIEVFCKVIAACKRFKLKMMTKNTDWMSSLKH